nr:Leucine-rich repeat serine/threonine-protein kinase 2 [Polyrhizophydium stewartii]
MEAIIGTVLDFVPVPLLRPAYEAVKGIANVASGVQSNRAVHACAAALMSLLADVRRFVDKHARRNLLRQILKQASTAEKLALFDQQLVALAQTLHLAVALDDHAMAAARQQDADELPELLNMVRGELEVQTQLLETLVEVTACLKSQMQAMPASVHDALGPLLAAAQDSIVRRSSRGLSAQREWTVDADDVDIDFDRVLGEGSFGTIYRGVWDGQDVAVKTMPEALAAAGLAGELIEREAAVWFPLNHPNVLKLYRVCLNADTPFIVMPLMRCDLALLLGANADLDVSTRLGFVAGVAKGLKYLHTLPRPLVHGDLKANNVLVGFDGQVAITDFGMAFVRTLSRPRAAAREAAAKGVRWHAPELGETGHTVETDVFAFAMTAVEILTGRPPLHDLVVDSEVRDAIRRGERPARPAGVPDGVWAIVEACWSADPAARPTMAQVVSSLAHLSVGPEELAERVQRLGIPPRPDSRSGSRASTPGRPDSRASSSYAASDRGLMAGVAMSPSRSADSATRRAAMPPIREASGHGDDGPRADAAVFGSAPTADPFASIAARAYPDPSAMQTADIHVVISAFPAWAARNDITPENWTTFRGTARVWDWATTDWRVRDQCVHDASGRITELRLADGDAAGTLPRQLAALAGLRVLYLPRNELTGAIPPEYGQLGSVAVLALHQNQLSGAIPAAIAGMASLAVLWLDQNNLTGSIPPEVGHLQRLEWLNASRNMLEGPLPRELFRLHALRELNLRLNALSGSLPREIGLLRNLRRLNLYSNRFSGQIPRELGDLVQLEFLDLHYCQFEGPIPAEIGKLARLVHLDLGNNLLSGPIPAEIEGCTSLVHLDLSHNSLSGPIPVELGRLDGLTHLWVARGGGGGDGGGASNDLHSNQLSGPVPRELGNCDTLTHLNLFSNSLSGPVPPELARLVNLEYLDIRGNSLGDLPPALSRFMGSPVLSEASLPDGPLPATPPPPQGRGFFVPHAMGDSEGDPATAAAARRKCKVMMTKASVKLPFKTFEQQPRAPARFYVRTFVVGAVLAAALEASMIQFGYYQMLAQGEAKRMAKAAEEEAKGVVKPKLDW